MAIKIRGAKEEKPTTPAPKPEGKATDKEARLKEIGARLYEIRKENAKLKKEDSELREEAKAKMFKGQVVEIPTDEGPYDLAYGKQQVAELYSVKAIYGKLGLDDFLKVASVTKTALEEFSKAAAAKCIKAWNDEWTLSLKKKKKEKGDDNA